MGKVHQDNAANTCGIQVCSTFRSQSSIFCGAHTHTHISIDKHWGNGDTSPSFVQC